MRISLGGTCLEYSPMEGAKAFVHHIAIAQEIFMAMGEQHDGLYAIAAQEMASGQEMLARMVNAVVREAIQYCDELEESLGEADDDDPEREE
ncbi:hypothetical protein [Chelativorans intermedius]|uniref:Uncharacterized protein n=1 Tax=Chelativorans intermedius TaxID=515947 RepID=A0ABV6D7G0_9HYPH|nr:hypothetical protein [Chelativorans intermedius]MCT8999216.1 hypothetical protein [Chelativorans intermedius]